MNLKFAYFAGGCFWCMQGPFDSQQGVVSTQVGFMGGHKVNPSYEQVCGGGTGHREAIKVEYNPQQVSYSELLNIFWQQIDPTDSGGQFADRGEHYKTAIFVSDDQQRVEAEKSKIHLQESGKFESPVVTEILPASQFYGAEEYHQKYYKNNPERYEQYKKGSGREDFICRIWK